MLRSQLRPFAQWARSVSRIDAHAQIIMVLRRLISRVHRYKVRLYRSLLATCEIDRIIKVIYCVEILLFHVILYVFDCLV